MMEDDLSTIRLKNQEARCLCLAKNGIAVLTEHNLVHMSVNGKNIQFKKSMYTDRTFYRIVQVYNGQLQGECEVYWIIENMDNAFRLTEIAMEDKCSSDVCSFTQRVITGAPDDIIQRQKSAGVRWSRLCVYERWFR
jgi:hypothetical protein